MLNSLPRVTVVSLGGTISSAPPADGGLVRPALSAADLVAAVPALKQVAEIEVRDVCRLPSNDMTFEIARAVADEIRAAVERGATGVVVTQGTDTIEQEICDTLGDLQDMCSDELRWFVCVAFYGYFIHTRVLP